MTFRKLFNWLEFIDSNDIWNIWFTQWFFSIIYLSDHFNVTTWAGFFFEVLPIVLKEIGKEL